VISVFALEKINLIQTFVLQEVHVFLQTLVFVLQIIQEQNVKLLFVMERIQHFQVLLFVLEMEIAQQLIIALAKMATSEMSASYQLVSERIQQM
jgi:hypothetical protein